MTDMADQSIPVSTLTALTFETETFDVGGMHDSDINPSRITIPPNGDGVYIVGANVHWNAMAGLSSRSVGIRLNSGNLISDTLLHVTGVGAFDFNMLTSCSWNFVAGDFIEVVVFQDTISAVDISSDADTSPIFWAQRLSD